MKFILLVGARNIKHFELDWPLNRIVCELMKRMILNLIRDDISVEQWLSDTYKIYSMVSNVSWALNEENDDQAL